MRKRLIIGVSAVLGLVALTLGANTLRNAAGWQPISQTPEERTALLQERWSLQLPQGDGPFPAMILLSGCDGVHDNMDYWAKQANDLGYAALILDSHGPRNLDKHQAWRAVCTAQILPGAERAGDIATAMAALDDMPRIDPKKVTLLGASHGGWSVMEYIQQITTNDVPPGLTDWPMQPELLRQRLGPVVMLYPYCGVVSRADDTPWPVDQSGLMVLAENDSIVDPKKCRDMATSLAAGGARLDVRTIKGADHGFDQSDRSTLSFLSYNQDQTLQATGLIREFLQPLPPTSAQQNRP